MKGRRLLLVEDQTEIRELVSLTLEPLGAVIFETNNIRDAWRVLEEQHPDTVLLDVNLEQPRDGLQLCRRIKQSAEFAEVRVVIISTASQLEDIERGRAAGADFYVIKPFSPAHLLDVVRAQRA